MVNVMEKSEAGASFVGKSAGIRTIGVIGAGQMGHGIAQVMAHKGELDVIVQDVDAKALERGASGIALGDDDRLLDAIEIVRQEPQARHACHQLREPLAVGRIGVELAGIELGDRDVEIAALIAHEFGGFQVA